jgi:cell division protein FtsI/penicillin-binding protein 2
MEPDTGKILAMISHDKYEPDTNNCIDSRFPAASIFKIVTAAAAIEECNLNSDSDLSFCGGKYTLYKSQLKKRTPRRSIRVAFKDSFAQSINPVFGKIGQHYLGREVLLDYAKSFGFNRPIDLEIPVESSVIHVSEKPYHWAEIACGFNRDTLISPLHAAMVASAVVNGGKLPKPHIIEEITDEKKAVLYKPTIESSRSVVDYQTSAELREMMENTIKTGTCRKFFRGYRKNDTLSRLDIGGKTGSLCGSTCNIRYDWFVGYAGEKSGSKKIAVAVFIAHEKYIGKRSSRIARIVLESYFEKYFAQQGI